MGNYRFTVLSLTVAVLFFSAVQAQLPFGNSESSSSGSDGISSSSSSSSSGSDSYGSNSEIYSSNSDIYSSNSDIYGSNSEIYSSGSDGISSRSSSSSSSESDSYGSNSEIYSSNSDIYGSNINIYGSNSDIYGSNSGSYDSSSDSYGSSSDSESYSGSKYKIWVAHVLHSTGVHVPTQDGSGFLTEEGIRMMAAVGTYVRARYSASDMIIDPESFLPSESYSPHAVDSQSADRGICIQSASAFLSGVFPSRDGFYPVVHSADTDQILSADAFPPVILKRHVDVEGVENATQPVLDEHNITFTVLAEMATEVGYQGCTEAQRGACAVWLYELLGYYTATSDLGNKPTLSAGRESLSDVAVAYYYYLFGYNNTDDLHQKQGSSGQFVGEEILRRTLASTTAAPTGPRVVEYSVDRDLITALSVTLGDQSNASMLTSYATTVFVEVLQDTVRTSEYAVRVVRTVTEEANGIYKIAEQQFSQKCARPSGEVYEAGPDGCALQDFIRFVNSTKPTGRADGYCTLDSRQADLFKCQDESKDETYCSQYRHLCPAFACPDGFVLGAADRVCHPIVVTPTEEKFVVQMVQVVHRHGARAPNVDFNRTQICGYEYPCGSLNSYGQSMLQAVGRYVRARYNNDSVVGEPFFPNDRYNSSLVYTRSTGMQRTIQSAASLLHEVFPDERYFFPVIFSANMTTDFLLNTDPMPPVMLKRWGNDAVLQEVLNPVVDEHFTWEELQLAAEDGFISGTCVDEAYRYQCALDVYDIATSFEATGRLDEHPRLKAALSGTIAVNTAYYVYVFGYNASDPLMRKQGAMAQNLAQEMLGNFHAHLITPSYRMFQYSTHDSMVAPLGVTLGDQSHETLEVPYAHTYILELLQSVGDGSYNVRVLRGYPKAVDSVSSNFTFVSSAFPQKCMDPSGVVYAAGENGCPLTDFGRFIDSTKPSEPNGYCNVDASMYATMQCPVDITDSKPLQHYCQLYRIACPAMSCAPDHVLSSQDLQCYPIGGAVKASSVSVGEPVIHGGATQLMNTTPAKRMSELRRLDRAASLVDHLINCVFTPPSFAT